MYNSRYPFNYSSHNRRKFITNILTSAGSLALLTLPALVNANTLVTDNSLTVQQIIDIILKDGNLTPIKDTVDTIKAGSPHQIVTGIITTMFATINVIEEAAKRNANFIIAHEPTFYNHRDEITWVQNNSIVKEKQVLLEKHKIAVWRFHDYCHALKPDAISYGVAKKAGWLGYFKTGDHLLTIPKTTLKQLVQHLKATLQIAHVRVIGNLNQNCETIALLPGAACGEAQVEIVEHGKPDVLIIGEMSEWETAEYFRDANLLGKKTALIILGHAASEDPGMEWMVDWLQPKLPLVPIKHIASGDPFIWM